MSCALWQYDDIREHLVTLHAFGTALSDGAKQPAWSGGLVRAEFRIHQEADTARARAEYTRPPFKRKAKS